MYVHKVQSTMYHILTLKALNIPASIIIAAYHAYAFKFHGMYINTSEDNNNIIY